MILSSLVPRNSKTDIDSATRQGFHAKLCHRNETLAECYDRLGIDYDSSEISGAASDSLEEEIAIGKDAEAAGDAAEAAAAAEIEDDDEDAPWMQILREAHWAQLREARLCKPAAMLGEDSELSEEEASSI